MHFKYLHPFIVKSCDASQTPLLIYTLILDIIGFPLTNYQSSVLTKATGHSEPNIIPIQSPNKMPDQPGGKKKPVFNFGPFEQALAVLVVMGFGKFLGGLVSISIPLHMF